MISRNPLSKILNAGTTLGLSLVLLGVTFPNYSWAKFDAIRWDDPELSLISTSRKDLESSDKLPSSPTSMAYGSLTIEGLSSEIELAPFSFKQIFECNPGLTKLTIKNLTLGGENALGKPRLEELASILQNNTTLKELTLLDCEIDGPAAKRLANVLQGNSTLTKLVLDRNKINDEGATKLAEGLRSNKTLRTLKLTGNQITYTGAYALVKPLYSRANTLKELDVGANQIQILTAEQRHKITAALKKKGVIVNFN